MLVGRPPFAQTARGMIAGNEDGFLKVVASPDGERVLGVAAVGEGASALVSVGQVTMLAGFPVYCFVRSVFNFPTMMEAVPARGHGHPAPAGGRGAHAA
jgi:pyruvate/2-oxoglutarate dehydrogenase complex dihydrolipoamide dehydrogenase (E3) component